MKKNDLYFKRVKNSVDYLKEWWGNQAIPEIVIVLGSGLSNAVPNINAMKSLAFKNIPEFKTVSVLGHAGDLCIGDVLGTLADGTQKTRSIAFLRGRNHAYEGYNAAEVVHNIRTLICWGVKGVILTTASGCLNPAWETGRMMLFTDHINLSGISPIIAPYGDHFGPRFIDMTMPYDKDWQTSFIATALQQNATLYTGVHCTLIGGQYETPAEIRMIQQIGAQSVSMSTATECIAARQLGAKVAAFSCFTNYGAGIKNVLLSHQEVTDMGKNFDADFKRILLNTAIQLSV